MKKSGCGRFFAILPGLVLWAACTAPGGEPPAGAPALEIDRERGEVRIGCRFVNATRNLEVFACHESGPTHETVVAFQVEGEALYRALKEIGLRGPEFWNATSPQDLKLTGGDRTVVWIQWEWKGRRREMPAEETLVEEGRRLPLFLRGFTFAGQRLQSGPESRPIPRAVELTIGGASRQSASFSLLYHPNDLPDLVSWMPAPEVSAVAVPDLEEMVQARAPARLIIRRLKSEVELISLALARESDPLRRSLRERQTPLAGTIDSAKKEFEAVATELAGILREGEEKKNLSPEERRNFAERIRKRSVRGARLAAEIRESYLRLWGMEEEYRFQKLRDEPGLEPVLKSWADMAYRSGFRFELALCAKSREIAALAEGLGRPDYDGLLRKALEAEMEALAAERERRWARFKLERETRPKLAELDPKKDEYTVQLFREDELRTLADMRLLAARIETAHADALELRSRADGTAERVAGEVTRRRETAAARSRLGEAERDLVELMAKVRWAKHPPGDEQEDPKEVGRLKTEEASTSARVDQLRRALEKALGRSPGKGEEPPAAPGGAPLYPEEFP